ncbi:MAG: peptidase M48 [Bacteroidetes bacterium HGW-Bacteroidetes-22]|nr:MAG: peptidase M48 [Bacteroidetes bacterium HGW-Bacteroidetes-22]
MFRRAFIFNALLLVIMAGGLAGCSENSDDPTINVFSVDDDIELGKQVDAEILANPAEYPLLDSATNTLAYSHLYRIRNTILASGKVFYAQRFGWRCRIIKNDSVVNAFCVPGGDMYFYTGLIKLLDNEAQFAGVMAHEMAHADRRHSTDQMTKAYGIQVLLSILLGNNASTLEQMVADLANGLGTLAFSRSNEYEADEYAVKYLYPTAYDSPSLGDFFTKLEGQSQTPTFLSTHPSPEDRLTKINEQFQALGGVHGQTFPERYNEFKTSLP